MKLPKRKPNRLKNYNYSQNGKYFVTICVKDKSEILWKYNMDYNCFDMIDILSEYGNIIKEEIEDISQVYSNKVVIDKYIIMPNHIHMIISLYNDNLLECKTPTISRIIQQFKGCVTKKIGFTIWQKLFHDRIIRNEKEYQKIWEYIETNPQKWEQDCFYLPKTN